MNRAFQYALALAFFALQCVSVGSWVPSYQLVGDGAEAVRLARACVEIGECTSTGTRTSALGLHHGASWIRLNSYFFRNGGGLQSIQTTTLMLLIVAGAVSFLAILRYVPARGALLVLLLHPQPAIVVGRFGELSNATLLPVTLALYYASAMLCVERRSGLLGAVASVCLAAAISANLSCLLMVPFHVGLVALFARRPIVDTIVAGVVWMLAFSLESSDSAGAIIAGVSLTTGVWVLLVAATLLFAVRPLRRRVVERHIVPLALEGRHIRKRLAALPVAIRLRAVMKGTIVYFSLAVWLACILVRSSAPESWYLAPLVFPLLFLAADAAAQLSRRALIAATAIAFMALVSFRFAPLAEGLGSVLGLALSALIVLATCFRVARSPGALLGRDPFAAAPSALLFGCVAFVVTTSLPDSAIFPRQRQIWPVGASEKVVRGLYESGLTFPQIMASLQGQSPEATIQSMVASFDPRLFAPPVPVEDSDFSLLVLMVEPAVVARTEGVAITFPIDNSRSAMVVRAPSYLDWTRVRTCYAATCEGQSASETCIDRRVELPLRWLSPYFPIDREESQVPGQMFSYHPTGRTYCVSFSIPVRTVGSVIPHVVRAVELWPLRTQIRRVHGVAFEGKLPGPEVRLVDDRAATGTIEVEVARDTIGPDADWLEQPALIEVTVANEHLLEPFRTGRTSLR